MTGSNMKRWREVEVELQTKRYRRETSTSDLSTEVSMASTPKRTTEDALAYLKVVRETFSEEDGTYKELLRILKEFQLKKIDTSTLVSLFKTLFKAHPELLLGLNEFLPKGYQVYDPASVVEVSSSCEEERHLPTDHLPNGDDVEETSPAKPAVDLKQALNFVNKVKIRFQKEELVYTGFLTILNLYKQGLEINEVTRRITSLFVGHQDLVEEFSGFLPPPTRPRSLPSIATRQDNPGRHAKTDEAPQVQQKHPKEAGKRATSPTDHPEAEDLGASVAPEHSPPQVKKQRMQADRDEDMDGLPMPSSPEVKKQPKSFDKEGEEKGKPDHSGINELPREVGDQACVHASQAFPLEHSPIKLNEQRNGRWKVCEENSRSDLGDREDQNERRQEMISSIHAFESLTLKPSPSKDRVQWTNIDKVEEENDATRQGESKEPGREGGNQINGRVSQKLPQEHSPTKIRKLQKTAEKVEVETATSHPRESREPAMEGTERTHIDASQKLPREHSPAKIRNQWQRAVRMEEETNTTYQIESEDSAQDVDEQTDDCSAQKLPEEHSPTKIRKHQKKTETGKEEVDNTTFQSRHKEAAEEAGDQTNVHGSQMLPQEHPPPKVRKRQEVEEENDTPDLSGSTESSMDAGEHTEVHTSEKLPIERSPLKVSIQQKRTEKIENENDKSDQSESEDSGKEVGDQTVAYASQNVPQKRSSARIAHELIRKQCQAAEAGLAVQSPCTSLFLEDELKQIRLQQLEDRKNLMLRQRQDQLFEKVKETLEGDHSSQWRSRWFEDFYQEVMSCPELQALVCEVLEEQELEYSQCRRSTASYYLLPETYVKPLTTFRRDLDWTVLNDSWVSAGYDGEDSQNSQDESSGARKQIGREGTGKRVPHDKRLLHEEKLFLCEDDQFELDVLRHTTANTIARLARMVELTEAPDFSMEFFDWDEHLSPVNFRCIERFYGDYGVEFIQVAQKNPVTALPIILGHLKQKEENEWPKYQAEMNKSWAEVHAEHFHESLDYSQFHGQQSDKMQLCTDSFQVGSELNEDWRKDDNIAPVADGELEHLTPFGRRDQEDMYQIIKHLLKEVYMTEVQFKKIQTIWSVHVEQHVAKSLQEKS